jgi:hypothetical protein
VTPFGVEVQLNKLAIRIKAVWIRLVESNHDRFFGRDRCAKRPKMKLPMQKLCARQLRRGKILGRLFDDNDFDIREQ